MSRTVVQNCHIATCDGAGTEYEDGYLVVEDDRIAAVGAGAVPALQTAAGSGDDVAVQDANAADGRTILVDGRDCLLTPGLVNTHHHLYQWVTRGIAQDQTLFGWLTTLYPIWAGIDAESVEAAAAANLGWLALTGCTTSSDHHYVFPKRGGDLMEAEIAAARRIGLRFHPARGSMDLGQSKGGLPPDSVVEDRDEILSATATAIDTYNDPSEESLLRIVVAPCSPFSVSEGLMRDAAELARQKGVRMHTHLAETTQEDDYCVAHYGCTPTQYAERLGWLGDDVWMAHCVHLDDEAIDRLAATGTGVAHCPTSNGRLGAGLAPVQHLLSRHVPVGLGVDGAASNESGRMVDELHQALLVARLRDGPLALSAREALRMATVGGARCLGRERELGSLEPGKLADLALWRVGGISGDGMSDPLATLVFGAPTLERLWVSGRPIVEQQELLTADARALGSGAKRAARELTARAGR
ncbi:MAG TPA: 8-oxoguanine deaminase [Solirubrobacteraceae bacterium]|jgi:cytosine/adenosine deaminase-related metal-dependent hydrolase|nr:8-oxoguanine deaminase [Solirubrobacteraceae bacterium]